MIVSHFSRSLIHVILHAVWLTSLPSAVVSRSVKHEGIAPAIVRNHSVGPNSVELVVLEFEELIVLKDGDEGSQGELNSISVFMQTLEEGDFFQWRAPFLENLTGSFVANNGYLGVDTGDIVRFLRPVGPSPDRQPYVRGVRGERVSIQIVSRELDCIRRRVCRRGDTGEYSFSFDLYVPTAALSDTCTEENIYHFALSDGVPRFETSAGVSLSRAAPILGEFTGGTVVAPFKAVFCVRRPQ